MTDVINRLLAQLFHKQLVKSQPFLSKAIQKLANESGTQKARHDGYCDGNWISTVPESRAFQHCTLEGLLVNYSDVMTL